MARHVHTLYSATWAGTITTRPAEWMCIQDIQYIHVFPFVYTQTHLYMHNICIYIYIICSRPVIYFFWVVNGVRALIRIYLGGLRRACKSRCSGTEPQNCIDKGHD